MFGFNQEQDYRQFWVFFSLHTRSVMQALAWAWRIFRSFCQEYPILGQELPHPPPKLKIWSGLGTLSSGLPRIPPPPPRNENLVSVWLKCRWKWSSALNRIDRFHFLVSRHSPVNYHKLQWNGEMICWIGSYHADTVYQRGIIWKDTRFDDCILSFDTLDYKTTH